jgi:hypothetical protein
MRSRARIGGSAGFGPFRFRLSAPVGRGRVRARAGVRTGRGGWLGVSVPLGGGKRGRT